MEDSAVSAIDWVVVGLSGALFLLSLAGALYVAIYGSSKKKAVVAEFNYLWRARFCFQLLAAAFAVVQILRLQVLWGPESVWISGGLNPTALCRAYIAVEYGVLEPALLLLALFACIYSLQRCAHSQGRCSNGSSLDPDATPPTTPKPGSAARHPNFNIVFFAVGFTLPCCTAQLVCALFTRIFDLDYQGVTTFRIFFMTYDRRQVEHCPPDVDSSHCAWCVFPLLSTLITVGFSTAFLLALLVVTGRIVAAVINKRLVMRVRMLQLFITLPLILSLVCRGVTVVFRPFELGFELLRLGHVVTSMVMVLAISYLLVVRPVRDAWRADMALKAGPPPMQWTNLAPGGSLNESFAASTSVPFLSLQGPVRPQSVSLGAANPPAWAVAGFGSGGYGVMQQPAPSNSSGEGARVIRMPPASAPATNIGMEAAGAACAGLGSLGALPIAQPAQPCTVHWQGSQSGSETGNGATVWARSDSAGRGGQEGMSTSAAQMAPHTRQHRQPSSPESRPQVQGAQGGSELQPLVQGA